MVSTRFKMRADKQIGVTGPGGRPNGSEIIQAQKTLTGLDAVPAPICMYQSVNPALCGGRLCRDEILHFAAIVLAHAYLSEQPRSLLFRTCSCAISNLPGSGMTA
jgi:hypothetical protein